MNPTTTPKQRKAVAYPLPALRLLAQAGARLLQVEGATYLLSGKESRFINGATHAALQAAGWISAPCELAPQIAEQTITEKGTAYLAFLAEAKGSYRQLKLAQARQEEEAPTNAVAPAGAPAECSDDSRQETPATSVISTLHPAAIVAVNCHHNPVAIEARTGSTKEAPSKKKRKLIGKKAEAAKQERADKLEQTKARIAQATADLLEEMRTGQAQRLAYYLAAGARFHNYSARNQLLILAQCPHATQVAGYHAWEERGYKVRKGEKGICILAPCPFSASKQTTNTQGEEEETLYEGVRFKLAYVFDVSQLEKAPEKPRQAITSQGDLYGLIVQAVRAEGITLEVGPTKAGIHGYSAGGSIRLSSRLDLANRLLTLIHEWAHEKLHWDPATRPQLTKERKECHAEAVAYVVAHHYGVESPLSVRYIKYYGNTEKELLAELAIIQTTAAEMIKQIDARLTTDDQDKEQGAPANIPAPTSAPIPPLCAYCGLLRQEGQTLNGVAVCVACIAQETAMLRPEDIEPPTDAPNNDPEPPAPQSGPTGEPPVQEEEPAPDVPSVTTRTPEPISAPSATTMPAQEAEPPAISDQRQGQRTIFFGHTSYKVTVSEAAYQQIAQIAQAMSVCHKCERHYTTASPNVAGNLCLQCFQERNGLEFIGAFEFPERYISSFQPYANSAYLWLDRWGVAHVTEAGPGEPEEGQESIAVTVRYWQFTLPTDADKGGRRVPLRNPHWQIYGDVRTDEVIMLRFWDTYPEDIDVLFLVKRRSGQLLQINKRKPTHRRLLVEARARLAATCTLSEVYRLVASIAAQRWDALYPG